MLNSYWKYFTRRSVQVDSLLFSPMATPAHTLSVSTFRYQLDPTFDWNSFISSSTFFIDLFVFSFKLFSIQCLDQSRSVSILFCLTVTIRFEIILQTESMQWCGFLCSPLSVVSDFLSFPCSLSAFGRIIELFFVNWRQFIKFVHFFTRIAFCM